MIRRLSALVLLCAASAMTRCAPAATSPLGADDYVWFKPGPTNLITGSVIGDTAAAGPLRYEDLAFLSEAVRERICLGATSYSSNDFATALASTNRDWSVTIGQKSLFSTSRSSRDYKAGDLLENYLSDTCEPSESARVSYTTTTSFNTNTVETEIFLWATNKYSLPVPPITQTMTNGTVNVYTNFTIATTNLFTSNSLYRVTATNLLTLTPADLCTKKAVETLSSSRLWRGLTKDYANGTTPVTLTGPYAAATLTNHYALVRAARLVVPRSYAAEPSATNATRRQQGAADQSVESLSYSLSSSRTYSYTDRQTKYDDWQSIDPYPVTQDVTSRSSTIPDTLPLRISTSLSDYMVGYRSEYGRVRSALAYALVYVRRHVSRSSSHTDAADGLVTDVYTNYTESGSVMVPLGRATRETGHENLTFTLTAPSGLYSTACGLVGIPYRAASFVPDLPDAGTAAYYETVQGSSREKVQQKYSLETLSGSMTVYLILEVYPNTKLSSWSEYEYE